jgi:hypothetical protein
MQEFPMENEKAEDIRAPYRIVPRDELSPEQLGTPGDDPDRRVWIRRGNSTALPVDRMDSHWLWTIFATHEPTPDVRKAIGRELTRRNDYRIEHRVW